MSLSRSFAGNIILLCHLAASDSAPFFLVAPVAVAFAAFALEKRANALLQWKHL